MTTHAHRFTVQHLVAAAALGGTAMALLLSRLDVLAVRLSPAARQAWALWWPLLLIVAGGILWLIHEKSLGTARQGTTAAMRAPEGTSR